MKLVLISGATFSLKIGNNLIESNLTHNFVKILHSYLATSYIISMLEDRNDKVLVWQMLQIHFRNVFSNSCIFSYTLSFQFRKCPSGKKKLWIRFLTLLSKLDWTYFQNGQNVELLKLFTGAEEGFSEVFFFLFAKPYLGKIFQIFFNNTDSGLKVGRFVPYFILRLFQGVL